MADMFLSERGYFWWDEGPLTEDILFPETHVAGCVEIKTDGSIEIHLDGVLSNEDGRAAIFAASQFDHVNKCIRGLFLKNNEPVWLQGLQLSGGEFHSHGISTQKFVAEFCVVGSSVFDRDFSPEHISKVDIDMSGFESWFPLGSIKTLSNFPEMSATYVKPDDRSYAINGGKMTVSFGLTVTEQDLDLLHTRSLTESVSISIEPDQIWTLKNAREHFDLFQEFLILVTDSIYRLPWPTVSGHRNDVYKFFFRRSDGSTSPPKFDSYCINYRQIKEKLGEFFRNWQKLKTEFGPGFYLYFGTKRGHKLYVENRFVNLVWGLETFHRRKYKNPINEKIKAKITRIIGQIEKDSDRRWLKNKLKDDSEPSLSSRISDLLRQVDDSMDQKLINAFSVKCADQRNNISHRGGPSEGIAYVDFIHDLNTATAVLLRCYHVLILKEIGIAPELLHDWLFESRQSFRIKRELQEAGLLIANMPSPHPAHSPPETNSTHSAPP